MLAEAVGSVTAQRGVDFELIIVDDGSTDESASHLPRWLESQAAARGLVRILRSENRGPAAARNCGVAAARAPFIAFLDSDDLWQPGKLARQLHYMQQKPHCVASQTDEVWMRHGVRVNPGQRHRKRNGDFFFDSLRTCLISPSAVIMRTAIFHQLGGFDEDLEAAEDYDLWLRLLLAHPVELLPELLVIRRAGHTGQLSATVPALDRFRILALLKLLRCSDLSEPQRQAVSDVLVEKCAIYGAGSARRGNTTEADSIAQLAVRVERSWRQKPDPSLECAIAGMRAKLARNHAA
jgi:glycosyltransferase involved in cell wall biosynthesis